MAKFCSGECKESGSICDFCKYYKDKYRDILQLKRKDGSKDFAGIGICEVDGKETDACSGFDCEDFECFRIEYMKNTNPKERLEQSLKEMKAMREGKKSYPSNSLEQDLYGEDIED